MNNQPPPAKSPVAKTPHAASRLRDLYQVVIECRDEDEQRELFERLQGEGFKVRLLVL